MLRPSVLDIVSIDSIHNDNLLDWLFLESITKRNSTDIMAHRHSMDGTNINEKTASSSSSSSVSLGKSALNVDLALKPLPIDTSRVEVRNELPFSESNIIAEGDDFVKSIISLLSSKPSDRKRKNEDISSNEISTSSPFYSLKEEIDLPAIKKRRQPPFPPQGGLKDIYGAAQKPKSNPSDSTASPYHLSDGSAGSGYSKSSTGSSIANKKQSFRSYQTALWDQRFNELTAYVQQHGNCLVPNDWKWNPSLSKWVKRQRYQYRLKQEGKHTTLTSDRQTALERLGFIWDPHKAVWEEHFQELRTFKYNHGHCNVPSNYSENYSLSVWVQCQRRQWKLYCKTRRGNPSGKAKGMDEDRITKLQELGFVWDPQNRDSPSTNSGGGVEHHQQTSV